MSKIWPNASKENPCKICGKPDWCSFGDRAIICRRIGSQFPHLDRGGNVDGHYHFYDDGFKPAYIPPSKPAPKPIKNIAQQYAEMDDSKNIHLAQKMGVTPQSLNYLGVRWSDYYKAWIFPMYDGEQNLIGLNRRFDDGSKKIVFGTSGGLYLSGCEIQGYPIICEGGGDSAALLDMGFFPIGRFTCSSGTEYIKKFCQVNKISRVVILSQNDCIKEKTGQRPGQRGALTLKKELGIMSVVITVPSPCKDVRELVGKLGADCARHILTDSIGGKVWSK